MQKRHTLLMKQTYIAEEAKATIFLAFSPLIPCEPRTPLGSVSAALERRVGVFRRLVELQKLSSKELAIIIVLPLPTTIRTFNLFCTIRPELCCKR